MKTKAEITINPQAKRLVRDAGGEMAEDLVRGFLASMSASKTRLNAMATDLAATIATTIQIGRVSKPARMKFSSRHG